MNAFQDHVSEYTIQIEKDLRRTFPDHEVFESDEGISTLRRVLVIYSWLNPEVGYCQSMNFIAALFLLFMDEEEAFWLLRVMIEDVLPSDYYTNTMIGVRADQKLFEELLEERLPKVHAHLVKMEVNLAGLVTAWFMSLFVNIIPLDGALRVLDILFSHGSQSLLRIALGIFKINEKAICKEKSFESLYLMLSDMGSEVDVSKLFEVSFSSSFLGNFKPQRIRKRRREIWDSLNCDSIAEHERRGQTLHFKVDEESHLNSDCALQGEILPSNSNTAKIESPIHRTNAAPQTPEVSNEKMLSDSCAPSSPRLETRLLPQNIHARMRVAMRIPNTQTIYSVPPISSSSSQRLSNQLTDPTMVDSRFQGRFRPLSIMVSEGRSFLPPLERVSPLSEQKTGSMDHSRLPQGTSKGPEKKESLLSLEQPLNSQIGRAHV